jgi:hypothetical protein
VWVKYRSSSFRDLPYITSARELDEFRKYPFLLMFSTVFYPGILGGWVRKTKNVI